ncbi:MAG: SPOR domain-containing protein [Spirochaetaceae bacterium]|nr:SPOR domain-containing protein [Spirochaetaceae bacterium]
MFFILILFILLPSTINAQTYSEFLVFEKNGETKKALEILYKLIETTKPENDQYFLIIDKIISLETDISKIISVENKILKIENINQKIQVLKKMAVIMELSGNIEKAGEYYEMIYKSNNIDENLTYLINTAIINLETGDIEKALSLSKFVENKAKKLIDLQKAILLTIYIDILEGNKDKALKKMTQILDDKYTEETLFIIYKISNWYDIIDTKEKAKNIIKNTHSQKLLDELDIYQKPFSPSFLFSTTEAEKIVITDNNQNTIYAYIQAGIYTSLKNAETMMERITKIGLPCEIMESIRNGEKYYRVVVPVKNEKQIENYNLILKDSNIESFLIFN